MGTPSAPPVAADAEIECEPDDDERHETVMDDATMNELTRNGLYTTGVGDCYEEIKQDLLEPKADISEDVDFYEKYYTLSVL